MTTAWRSTTWLLLGASLILALSLGIRHGFGLFLPPMSAEFGWGREVYAFAIALQNLIWGLAQPFTGALADRFGARRTIVVGGLLYAVGLLLMGLADSPLSLSLSAGLLIGIGLSGTSFSVILGVVGRAVPVEKRSMAMGIAAAAGSFGQFAMLPGTLGRNLRVLQEQGLLQLGEGRDQRSRQVLLSAAGVQRLQQALPLWQQVQDELNARLGEERRAELMQLLEQLA